ncbi:cystathionine gamma-synthase [Bacillus anthracis]|uniref:cysteine-S-conjugate beta-lyase n=1 Tax=Bacillus tropicus TaxID=2026188 RepID=A0ABD7ZVN7_9BACI|nr:MULTISPECIES: cystathionine beta-lyase [Bacillus]AJG92281.1 cystathionine beta-lyase metC [Bacillus cereus]AJH74295.1 cys/Met metabolism PLP-dependent enzyme family protein [Bacillus cereus ATCC 4342]AJI05061.1 cys/Met metabolism PLP-dependent enzyme family protein [Bacillus cereus G9241]ARO19933.1 cystathionine gamma-synthase [Bacillus cereus]ARZ64364.1 cystathionine gamma-synthase [Bacillus thuringiensis]
MSYSIDTLLLHNQYKHDPQTGAVNVPIYNTSTFHQFDVDTFGKYDYSRSGNPTREALEDIIALLEGGTKGFAFASGIAAISTAFLLLSQGDHVLISEDVYGGTYRIITEVLSRYGVSHTFVDMTNLEEIKQNIKPNTKLFYVETPSNPLLKVTDIRAVSTLAKSIDALTFVDNTFLTPLFQKPLDLGADVVLHSATKFIAGHSDVTAGLAVVKDAELAQKLGFLQNAFGAILGPQDCSLVLRGLKTLHVRLEHSATNANKIAHYLQEHAKVQNVYYPGLQAHLGFDIQQSQATSAGAVLSFTLQSEDALRQFLSKVKLPVFAVSLGAVESILSYPAKMSHAALSQEARDERGISNSLLRLSVGLENVDDLISDFENALSYVEEPVNA